MRGYHIGIPVFHSLDNSLIMKKKIIVYLSMIVLLISTIMIEKKSAATGGEELYISEVVAAAVRAVDAVVIDVLLHLFVGPAIGRLTAEVLDKLVSSVAGLAVTAVHKWVGEAADMTCSHPDLWIHKDSGVKTDIVWGLLNELLEPSLLDVVLVLDA